MGMKVMIIGAGGQLGSDLTRELSSYELIPMLHSDIEVADIGSIRVAFSKFKPDAVINTAAFHQPDQCEENPDKAFLVNALGARNLAVVAGEEKIRLVQISSDYVFGGDENRRIPYTEFDPTSPINVVGRAKVAAEKFVQTFCPRHFIVRVSGLFGLLGRSGKGTNFVETILRLSKERSELRVVTDQIFSPTYCPDAARKIGQIISTDYYGIYHITNQGSCSWYEFSREILRLAGSKVPVTPITSEQYHAVKARRPCFSVLDNCQLRLLGINDMKPWQEALLSYMKLKGHLATG